MSLGALMKQFKHTGRQKTFFYTKCYIETAIKRVTYLATLMSVHGLAFSVFVLFSER